MKESRGNLRAFSGWIIGWSAFAPLVGIAFLAVVFSWSREQILQTMVAVAVGALVAGAWSAWKSRRRS